MSFKEMGSVKEQYLLGPVPISTHLAYPMEFKFKRNDASILLALAPKILEINLHHFLTREGQHPNGTKILLSVNLMENALAATNFGHQLMNKLSYEQFSDAKCVFELCLFLFDFCLFLFDFCVCLFALFVCLLGVACGDRCVR